jgi:hypothetical protein
MSAEPHIYVYVNKCMCWASKLPHVIDQALSFSVAHLSKAALSNEASPASSEDVLYTDWTYIAKSSDPTPVNSDLLLTIN